MLSEDAIKRIQESYYGEPKIIKSDDDNHEWIVWPSGTKIIEIEPHRADCLAVATLDGFIDYVNGAGPDLELVKSVLREKILVHIDGTASVWLLSNMDPIYKSRDNLVHAKALVREFPTGMYHNMEDLVIELMTGFHFNTELKQFLQFVGNVQTEDINKSEDDGVSQKVTVKTSVSSVAMVDVPNPVKLRPFVTFPEVDHIDMNYIFRLRKNGNGTIQGALFSTNSIAWKRDCIKNIRGYILENAPGVRIIC